MAEIPRKLCAWITRHAPTRAQRQQLIYAGYEIEFFPLRITGAEDILSAIRMHLECEPDLIVAALPKPALHFLAKLAPCPVVIAKMDYRTGTPRWTGKWRKVVRIKLETQPFRL